VDIQVGSLLPPLISGLLSGAVVAALNHQFTIRQTRFSRLHERRVEELARLYGMLTDLEFNVQHSVPVSYRSAEQTREYLEAAHAGIEAISQYLPSHRLYFDPKVCNRIDNFVRTAAFAALASESVSDPSRRALLLSGVNCLLSDRYSRLTSARLLELGRALSSG
jgi:hypothetical protein